MAITGWQMKDEGASKTNDWYLYCSFIASQLGFFLAALTALRFMRQPIKQFVVKQKCHWKYFIVAITLQIGLFALSEVNNLFLIFLEKFGYQNSIMEIPSMDGFGLVWVLLVIGFMPAVFEELLFRGVILNGLRSLGALSAILVCGGLFALFHQSPAQTIYQFCCGAAFALVAIKSGSILPTMLAHFLNNTVILLLTYFGVTQFTMPVLITVICVASVCLIGSLVYLIFIDKKSGGSDCKKQEIRTAEGKNFFIFASLGIAVCLLSWISALLMGM